MLLEDRSMTKVDNKDTRTRTFFKTNNESMKMTFGVFIVDSNSHEYFGVTWSHDREIFCEFWKKDLYLKGSTKDVKNKNYHIFSI